MEDYKQKYKKAIERAKAVNPGTADYNIVTEIFPELKESEDERIRKQLLNWFKCCNWNAIDNGTLKRDDIIAWLEKQGKIKCSDYLYIPGWRENRPDNKPEIKHSILMLTTHGIAEGEWLGEEWCQYRWSCKIKDTQVLYWLHLFDLETLEKENAKQDFPRLEKQDEHFTHEGTFVNVDDVRDDFMNEVYRILDTDSTNDRANQIIQAFDSLPTVTIKKPQDKPILEKFEVGDWVVPNNGEPKVFRVEERGWPDSVISSSLGNQYVNTFTLDKQYHLWTIQDAKDGDVLVTKDRPFLFKGFSDECSEHPVAYCGIDTTNAFYISTSNSHWTYNICLLATKEQHDLLFTKMKEAGYEWDAEKKELKKIEQKHRKWWKEVGRFKH